MSADIEQLDKQGYRKFGIVTGLVLLGLFGLAIPYLFTLTYPRWPWYIASALIFFALFLPMSLRYPYDIWMKFGLVMNWINTRLILGMLFFVIFFPVGLLLKLFGKDPMHRQLDKKRSSYREFNEHDSKTNLEKPY